MCRICRWSLPLPSRPRKAAIGRLRSMPVDDKKQVAVLQIIRAYRTLGRALGQP
jgi:hypothetical protein